MNSHGAKALFEEGVSRLDDRLAASRGWVIHSQAFPILDLSFRDPGRQELRLRLGFEDWHDTPPSVDLLAPDGSFLTALPQMRSGAGAPIFNGSPHQRTGRPFVCMVGCREYHDHSGHMGDLWTNYQGHSGYTLGGVVDRLWGGWRSFWP